MFQFLKKLLSGKPYKYQKFEKVVARKAKQKDITLVELWVKNKIASKKVSFYDANLALFAVYKDIDPASSIPFGEKALAINYEERLAGSVYSRIKLIERKHQQQNSRLLNSYNVSGLIEYSKTHDVKQTSVWIDKAIYLNPDIARSLCETFFRLYKDNEPEYALRFGKMAMDKGADDDFKTVLKNRSNRFKKLHCPLNYQSYQELKEEILRLADNDDIHAAIELADQVSKDTRKTDLKIILFRKIKDSHTKDAAEIGWQIFKKTDDVSFLKVLGARLYALKEYGKAWKVYASCLKNNFEPPIEDRLAISLGLSEKKKIIELSFLNGDLNKYLSKLLPSIKGKDKINRLSQKVCFYLFKDMPEYSDKAIILANQVLTKQYSAKIAFDLSKLVFNQGKISDSISNSFLDQTIDDHRRQIELNEAYLRLLKFGMPLPSNPKYKNSHLQNHTGNNVLFTLYNSLPIHSAGYASRSHGLMLGLKGMGYEINALTRLGYPQDLQKFKNRKMVNVELVGGIKYQRLPTRMGHGFIPLDKYIKCYAEQIAKHANLNKVTLLHSASNFVNGIATNYAAKMLGIKSIYEVRGLWEITRISRQPQWYGSEHYLMSKRLETESAKNADHVITITKALKNELIRRGVHAKRITVIPNGVNISKFRNVKRNHLLSGKLDLDDHIVIGYVGSIVDYEGLDLLLEAILLLRDRGVGGFKTLIVGDGVELKNLKSFSSKHGLDSFVVFTGRVPFEQVEDYYSLIDICPFPRKGLPVCEMVSPLKPFEAMAMGKAIVSSDVAALAEIINIGHTGLTHRKDDAKDLADKLEQLIINRTFRNDLGKNSRRWVQAERDWNVLAKRVASIYKDLAA